jgi:hypothetical protein
MGEWIVGVQGSLYRCTQYAAQQSIRQHCDDHVGLATGEAGQSCVIPDASAAATLLCYRSDISDLLFASKLVFREGIREVFVPRFPSPIFSMALGSALRGFCSVSFGRCRKRSKQAPC